MDVEVSLGWYKCDQEFPLSAFFSVIWHLWESLGLLVKIKLLKFTCDMIFVFQLFSSPNYILTVIILFAFLYHLQAETQKIPCSVFSAGSDLALLWSRNWLQFSPMEYCLIVNLFSTKEIKALHYSPDTKNKPNNSSHSNSHMHKDTHMQGVNSCDGTSDLYMGLKISMLLLKFWPKFSFKVKN